MCHLLYKLEKMDKHPVYNKRGNKMQKMTLLKSELGLEYIPTIDFVRLYNKRRNENTKEEFSARLSRLEK